jgi:histidyl-tRNA synthetase
MVAARANALRKPVRWFSIPQLFRYERQQKGRLREHFQLNVDIFGEADVAADAELLAVACEVMRACGLGPDDVIARVSDRRLLTALVRGVGVPDEAVGAVFGAVDKIEREPRESLLKKMADAGVAADVGGRVLDLVQASDFAALRTEFAGDPEVTAALERFDEYRRLLEAHGVGEYLTLDLTIVRGLAYYTGIVFELFDAKGEFRAVCGGGRYDNLLSALGGVDMPALGFGMGDVVLGELLKARGKMPSGAPALDYWVAPVDPAHRLAAVEVAGILRAAGWSVEYPLKAQALAKQLKAAQAAGARRVIFVGDAYATSGEVEVKEFETGEQHVRTLEAEVSRERRTA